MKIAVVTDKSKMEFLPTEESLREDMQKQSTATDVQKILSKKYECIHLTFTDNIIQTLKKEKVDLVFNLCNGINGNSKLAQLPAVLEFANIPYTGSSILGHALAINKIYSSHIFKCHDIPTPDFIYVYDTDELYDYDIEFPVLVKPCDEGSSRGIHQDSLVFEFDSLVKKVKSELNIYNPPIMVCEYIEGREFSVGIVGNDDEMIILPIQEVDLTHIPDDLKKFYSFEIKMHYKDSTVYHCPAPLDEDLEFLMKSISARAYNALSLQDYARVDIRLKDGIPYVLEINSLPGLMKEHSALYRMANSCDLGYEGLIFKIVDCAIKRHNIQ